MPPHTSVQVDIIQTTLAVQTLEQLSFLCVCTGSPYTSEHPTRRWWRATSAANSATVLATTVTAAGTEGGQLQSINNVNYVIVIAV